jgi:myosin-1
LTHHIAKGKPGTIEITHGGPVTGITKGKNGHLMVVSKIFFFFKSILVN